MKIDLDDLERKARAATQVTWHADDDAGVLDDEHGKFVVHAVGRHPTQANAQHIAANSPPVTLALVARIRELEAMLVEQRNELRDGCLGQREIDALLEKGVVLP